MSALDTLRSCAHAGYTRKEAAEWAGVTVGTVNHYAFRHGLKFKRAGTGAQDKQRAELMASLYKSGYTLTDIGDRYGVTRQRVEQILKRDFGIRGRHGGNVVRAKRKAQATLAKKQQACLARYGCTLEQHQHLRAITQQMIADGVGRERTPIGAFATQKCNARTRGIPWELSLWDWWTIWQASGKWNERGLSGYVMCRYDHQGPYSLDNVFIATSVENIREGQLRRRQRKLAEQSVELAA